MALKFLNKKGWHTGSLRNIENVWKAEQKHDAEQKKLEELRKQIQEEREKSEFRLLQEQAGLVPRQERLDFLYESGLAVGKGSSDGFKALEALPKPDSQTASSSSAKPQQPSVPGALFEEKPQSANDAWRKLHSDPLLLIRQREQEALARVKNNPVQMAMIRKSVQAKKQEENTSESKKSREKHDRKKGKHQKQEENTSSKKSREKRGHKKAKHQKHSLSESQFDADNVAVGAEERRNSSNRRSSKYDEHSGEVESSERESREKDIRRNRHYDRDRKYKEISARAQSDLSENGETRDGITRNHDRSKCENYCSEGRRDVESGRNGREDRYSFQASVGDSSDTAARRESQPKRRSAPKLSEEERAARLQEMQMDAELHEQQRWKRLKKAAEDDAQEATKARMSSGRNFLDAAKKSVYGAEKGGSSTIEESVRRRTHYSQRSSEAGEANAFRR